MAVMLAWGLNIPAVKSLSGRLDELWVAASRMLVAAAVLTVCILARDGRLPRPDKGQFGGLLVAGLLMVYVNQLLFVHGMHLASATGASLVMGLSPALSALVAAIVFRDRLTVRKGLGLAAGFAGVAIVVLATRQAGGADAGVGELVLLAGLLTFVIGGAVVQQLARRLDALSIGWCVYLVGSVALVVHAALSGEALRLDLRSIDAFTWLLVAYSGVIGTALSNVGWYHGIARVGMARAAQYVSLLPVFGVGFSVLTLGEELTAWHLAGIVLVVTAIRLGATR